MNIEEARFEVKMTQKYMYDFLLNHTYRSMSGIMSSVFALGAFVLCAVTFGDVPAWQSAAYGVFGAWFAVYLPVSLYMRAGKQVKMNPAFKKPIFYQMDKEGIVIRQDEKEVRIGWEDIMKIVETKRSLLIYTGMRYSFIWPKECMGEERYRIVERQILKNVDLEKIKTRKWEKTW